jgi:hypothetical protein
MKGRHFFLIFIVLQVLVIPVSTDSNASLTPYIMETSDKRFVFVMLSKEEAGKIRNSYSIKYPQSGLYLNDGSTKPIWTVNWAARVFLPSDGVHVVRKGAWPLKGKYDEEAISFFANGKQMKSYSVRDLVDFPWLLPETASHYEWLKSKNTGLVIMRDFDGGVFTSQSEVTFDESSGTMSLETLQSGRFVFDLKTGEIISSHRPVYRVFIFVLIAALFIVMGIGYYLFSRNRNRRAAHFT